jgi:hypothetical protein
MLRKILEKIFIKNGKFGKILEKCSFRNKSLAFGLAKSMNDMNTLNMAKIEEYSGPVRIEMPSKNLQPFWKKWKISKIQKLQIWKTLIST